MNGFTKLTLGAVLCNSTIPAVNQDGVSPHFKSGEQELYTLSDDGGMAPYTAPEDGGPAIIALSPTDSEFLILTGTCDDYMNGKEVRVSSTWEGLPNDMPTPTTSQVMKLNDGKFKVKLPLTGNKNRIAILGHPIEFYAVSPWCFEFLARDGLELDLLRFFVLTTRIDNHYVADFAAHVLTQVHYHSGFKYNTHNGYGRYVQQNPWHFVLNRWLKDLGRNRDSANKYTMNCVDLAQIVGIAVSLCFEDAEDAQKLQWCSMVPFGFIKPVHLMGFENATNSPFVDEFGNWNPLVDANEPYRRYFSNHWFIMWKEKILDATCGPQVGENGIKQYLAGAIDQEYNHETPDNKGKKINGTIKDWSHHPFSPMLGGPILEYQAITGYDDAWVGTNPEILASVSKLQEKGDIKFKIATLVDTLNSRCGPSYILEPDGVFGLNLNPSTPELGNTIHWPIRCEYKNGHKKVIGRVDLQITIFDSPQRALDKTMSTITTANRTLQDKGPYIVHSAIVHATNGPDSVHMYWSYGHLFVDLFGLGLRDDDVMRIVYELQAYLEETGKTSYPEPAAVKSGAATSDDGSLLPSSMTVRTTVDVFIKVENYLRYDWTYDNQALIMRSVDTTTDAQSGVTTFLFKVYGRSKGHGEIIFRFLGPTGKSAKTVFRIDVE